MLPCRFFYKVTISFLYPSPEQGLVKFPSHFCSSVEANAVDSPGSALFTQKQSDAWDLGGDVEGGHPDPNLELVWGCIAWRMFSDKPFRNPSG